MSTEHPRKNQLEPKEVIENITIKKILNQFPEFSKYKSLIKFHHVGTKASLNLTLLPTDVIITIEKFMAGNYIAK